MTLTREIKPGVQWVGAIDWDRRLFDALIPLPDGTSYNSYLIQGSEKTALIDAVDETMAGVLLDNLRSLGIKRIDYIIAQHAEQDHSGSLRKLLMLYPDATVLGSARCLDLLAEFDLVGKERMQEAKDGETISSGGQKPAVHSCSLGSLAGHDIYLSGRGWHAFHLRLFGLASGQQRAVRRGRGDRLQGCQKVLRRDHDALPAKHQQAPGQD